MDHGAAAVGCGGCRTGYSGTSVYDRDLHWLCGGRAAGCGTGDCRTTFAHASVDRRVGPRPVNSGLDQCGVLGPDGSGDLSTRRGLHHRSVYDSHLRWAQLRWCSEPKSTPSGWCWSVVLLAHCTGWWLVICTIRTGRRFGGPCLRLTRDCYCDLHIGPSNAMMGSTSERSGCWSV